MDTLVIDHDNVLSMLPDRDVNAHKGCFGKILLLCGSEGYTGAAALSAMGALRCGAGLVYLGVPRCIYSIMAVKLNEPVVFPLPDSDGMLSAAAIQQIGMRLNMMDAVLIGPGLGQSEGTLDILRYVLESYTGPVVLDADGINLLAEHKDLLRGRTGVTILTPHEGEFRRLGYARTDNKALDAATAAVNLGVIMVLKGHNTVITDGHRCYINPTGNPGMAVGGSGDVLAGMITAFLGMNIPPLQAAACGAWLHGAAGDRCAQSMGQYGMLPSDMLDVLPQLMK